MFTGSCSMAGARTGEALFCLGSSDKPSAETSRGTSSMDEKKSGKFFLKVLYVFPQVINNNKEAREYSEGDSQLH